MVIVLWCNYKTCRENSPLYDRSPHPPPRALYDPCSHVWTTKWSACAHIVACLFFPAVLTDRPPPIIRQGPSNQTLGVDSVALFKCQASGDPIPSVSWLKDGDSLLGKDARMSLQELGSLQIKNVKVKSATKFVCLVSCFIWYNTFCFLCNLYLYSNTFL